MKIKLAENIPVSLLSILSRLGHDVDTIPSEGLTGQKDQRVWAETQTGEPFFVTQDMDFSDLRAYKPGSHHDILLVRLRNPGRATLTEKLGSLFQQEDVEKWAGCFVVVTDSKMRIYRSSQHSD